MSIERLRANDVVTACPHCGSTRPAFSITLLRSPVARVALVGWAMRMSPLRRYVSVTSGERFQCEVCHGQYSVDVNGTYNLMEAPERAALPLEPDSAERKRQRRPPDPEWLQKPGA